MNQLEEMRSDVEGAKQGDWQGKSVESPSEMLKTIEFLLSEVKRQQERVARLARRLNDLTTPPAQPAGGEERQAETEAERAWRLWKLKEPPTYDEDEGRAGSPHETEDD